MAQHLNYFFIIIKPAIFMKQYTFEEFLAYIQEFMQNHPEELIVCRARHSTHSQRHRFIKLTEDICYKPYWRGGPLTFQQGDYIHADPKDIYGITAAAFERCYIPVN